LSPSPKPEHQFGFETDTNLHELDDSDQLIKILGKLPVKQSFDFNFLKENRSQLERLKSIHNSMTLYKSVFDCFKFTTDGVKLILSQMIEFNPNNRLTAARLLESKIFDPIRQPELENM
jgi:serine/threonine protein kinase